MSAVFELDSAVQMNHQCQRVRIQRERQFCQESKQYGIRRRWRLQEGGVGKNPGEHLHSLGQPPAQPGQPSPVRCIYRYRIRLGNFEKY